MAKKLYIDPVTQAQLQPVVFELLYFKELGEYQVNYNGGEFALRFDDDQFKKTMSLMLEAVSTT